MPSQPCSPTRRENSGASVSSRLGVGGSRVPAAISSARKARTCLRSFSHSGGRRIGSKRRAAVVLDLVPNANVFSKMRIEASQQRKCTPSPTQLGFTRVGHLKSSKSDISDFDGRGLG